MATSTKDAMGAALKQMMVVKPLDKITVKDLVEICGVNRQTFYYHFDDVYHLVEWIFQTDLKDMLPTDVEHRQWREDADNFFEYLFDSKEFLLNVYNSSSRLFMLRFFKEKLYLYIENFATLVSDGKDINKQDFEFVTEFYSNGIVGLISQFFDRNLLLPKEMTKERFLNTLDNSVENILERFSSKKNESKT